MPAVIRQGKVIATCCVCGKMAHESFGPYWSCPAHLEQVDAMWNSAGRPAK